MTEVPVNRFKACENSGERKSRRRDKSPSQRRTARRIELINSQTGERIGIFDDIVEAFKAKGIFPFDRFDFGARGKDRTMNEPNDDYEEEQLPPIEKLGNEFYETTLAEIRKMRDEAHRRNEGWRPSQ
jgi:hypothetical protein